LYFAKFANAESGSTEGHTVNSESSYNTFNTQVATPGRLNDANNGTWVVESRDLYFIKTKNADSGAIEVHRMSTESKFSAWDVYSTFGFSIQEASSGIFTIDNDGLCFIKVENVPSEFIEVHKADHQKDFAADFHQTCKLSTAGAANGHLNVQGGNLYLIKTRGTEKGKVEVLVADVAGEQAITRRESTADDQKGIWQVDTKGDPYFISTRNPQVGASGCILQRQAAAIRTSHITSPRLEMEMRATDSGRCERRKIAIIVTPRSPMFVHPA
jgi:hypothetical protein